MTGLADALVGRRRELELIERALAEVEDGATRILAVSGEPGIGKTRLLGELAKRADERGWLVLDGHGSEFEHELPFGVVLDACDDYLASLDQRTLERIAGDGLEQLSTIFPSLRDAVSEPAHMPADERHLAYRRVRELLDGLGRRQPVLLALDDVHWADDASAELLAFLLRRSPRRRVAIALAYRRAQAAPRLHAAIERVAREGGLVRVELELLSRDEAALLLAGVPSEDREMLYEQAGGNPFYLEQLARAATDGEAPRERRRFQTADGSVPPAVAASLTEELEALSEGARRLLDGAAVAGDPFEPELAAAAAGVDEASALEALDELLAHRVVRPGELPRRFHFRHPLLRHAVYEGISAGWRIGAHARACAALGESGHPPERLAHHVERSAAAGDMAAVDVLTRAGHATAASAPGSAARWFDAALRLLPPTDATAEARLGLHLAHAGSLGAVGELEQCRAALIEALALVPPEAAEARLGLTAACATVEHLLGRHDEALVRVDAALEGIEDPRGEHGVLLTIEQAVGAFYVMDFERMHARAEVALDGARELDDRVLVATATALLCYAGAATGDIEGALRHQATAAEAIGSMSDQELGARPDALSHLGWAEFFLERYDDAIAHLERGMAVARASGQGQLTHVLQEGLGVALLMSGRLAEARQRFEATVDAARLVDNRQALCWALTDLAWASSWQGEADTAILAGEESVDVAKDLGAGYHAAAAHCSLATAYLDAGQPERCAPMLVDACGGPELPLMAAGLRCIFYDALVRAELGCDRPAEAARWAELSEENAGRLGLAVAQAEADRARARVLLAAGDGALAAALAGASADEAAAAGAAIEAGRSRLVAGQALAAAGEREAAVETLERAAAELEACGALRFHAEAARELRRLGVRRSPKARPGRRDGTALESLTAREREIAELVADRKMNAEIATELFLSLKTVETHLRNIFRKLEVSSRLDVAALVERERREV